MKQKDAIGYSEEDKANQKKKIYELQIIQSENEEEIRELKKIMSEARKEWKIISRQMAEQLELYYRMTQ